MKERRERHRIPPIPEFALSQRQKAAEMNAIHSQSILRRRKKEGRHEVQRNSQIIVQMDFFPDLTEEELPFYRSAMYELLDTRYTGHH